jgi:hypothetical protein
MRRREDEEPDKERRAEGEREAHPRPSKRPLQRGFFSSASSARWLTRSMGDFLGGESLFHHAGAQELREGQPHLRPYSPKCVEEEFRELRV